MAYRSQIISLILFVLAARHVATQGIMGEMHATDAIWNGMEKNAMHSHLQRMLQLEAEREPEAPGGHQLDDFGIPLPAEPKVSRSSAKQQMHVAPQKGQASNAGSTTSSGARPPMTEQEAARLASQQAANTAAREAALARKRQMVQEELAAAAATKKAKRAAAATASARRTTSTKAEQRRRTTSTITKDVKPAVAAASWGMLGYLLSAVVALGSVVALFTVIAVIENALLARKAGGGNWLSLTRGLWRRCRRAFAAARKQLTGHGSDLPLSANEGTGQLARTFAAASAFVHVFWNHLADHRGQHLGGAVTAALNASRRASTGGCAATSAAAAAVPDRSSAGGGYPASMSSSSPSSSPSYYGSSASPFGSPHYQRRRV